MAYGEIAKPGSKFGPCAEACGHTDCAETRSMATAACLYCQKQIGYEKAFTIIPDAGLAHFWCAMKVADDERDAYRKGERGYDERTDDV